MDPGRSGYNLGEDPSRRAGAYADSTGTDHRGGAGARGERGVRLRRAWRRGGSGRVGFTGTGGGWLVVRRCLGRAGTARFHREGPDLRQPAHRLAVGYRAVLLASLYVTRAHHRWGPYLGGCAGAPGGPGTPRPERVCRPAVRARDPVRNASVGYAYGSTA